MEINVDRRFSVLLYCNERPLFDVAWPDIISPISRTLSPRRKVFQESFAISPRTLFVVSTHYLDNGDNNTLFFLSPVALVVGQSYFFLRLDLFMVQLAAMSLSFYGHVYIDKQFHVAGSWLGRFSWFRRKQQLHFVHHRHANCNFAVIDFFWDRILGAYRSVEATRAAATSSAAQTITATSTP